MPQLQPNVATQTLPLVVFQKDPEFEALHPRDERGRFVESSKLKALQEQTRKWSQQLDKGERRSVGLYSGGRGADINVYARTGKREPTFPGQEDVKELVRSLDSALDKARLPVGFTLYRGMNARQIGSLRVGAVFIDKGYVSSALDYPVAESWALAGGVTRRVGSIPGIMRIRTRKGQRGAWVHPLALQKGRSSVSEVVFPRSSRFRIDRISKKRNLVIFDVTYLGQGKVKKFQKDPGFEALHPRDELGRFVEKAKVEAINEEGKRWSGDLNSDEKSVLVEYAKGSAFGINDKLRTGKGEPSDRVVGLMDSAIAKTHIPQDIVLYRGFRVTDIDRIYTGAEFTDLGFVSTSMDFSVAKDFHSILKDKGVIPGIMRIKATKGQPGAYLGADKDLDVFEQFEMVLPRGSRFRIDRISKDTRKRLVYYDVTYLGQGKVKKFQKDPEFEAKHPRDEEGRFVEKAKVEAVVKESERWSDRLAVKELEALEAYAGDDYQEFNNFARTGQGGFGIEEMVEDMDKALRKSKLPTDLVLYRGMNVGRVANFKPGAVFTDKGFVSTSLDAGVAKRFSKVAMVPSALQAIMRVRAPAGRRGAYLGSLSPMKGEHEVLLPRNSRFRIDRITKDSKKNLVYVDATYQGQGKGT